MSSIYIVKLGESIVDVCENTCGNLTVQGVDNLDAILTANNFDTWTPALTPGQAILIPDTVQKDLNALRQLIAYPICNTSVNNIDAQIKSIFDELGDNWILKDGFWNDDGIWIDTDVWKDS